MLRSSCSSSSRRPHLARRQPRRVRAHRHRCPARQGSHISDELRLPSAAVVVLVDEAPDVAGGAKKLPEQEVQSEPSGSLISFEPTAVRRAPGPDPHEARIRQGVSVVPSRDPLVALVCSREIGDRDPSIARSMSPHGRIVEGIRAHDPSAQINSSSRTVRRWLASATTRATGHAPRVSPRARDTSPVRGDTGRSSRHSPPAGYSEDAVLVGDGEVHSARPIDRPAIRCRGPRPKWTLDARHAPDE